APPKPTEAKRLKHAKWVGGLVVALLMLLQSIFSMHVIDLSLFGVRKRFIRSRQVCEPAATNKPHATHVKHNTFNPPTCAFDALFRCIRCRVLVRMVLERQL